MLSSLVLSLLVCSASGEGPDVLVVCPAELQPGLSAWLDHRHRQGHRVAVIDGRGGPEHVQRVIRRVAESGALRYVVLVGDAGPTSGEDAAEMRRCLPPFYANAEVVRRFGSEPEIATDSSFADLDGDRVPDLAVGRLTADTPAELARITGKILRYEQSRDFGLWRRRINFVAGVGGFGAVTDGVLEMTAREVIAECLPVEYSTTMTHASWRSPFCPAPDGFCNATLERLNEGCLFWVYMGHGNPLSLDEVRVPGGVHRILDRRDVARLRCDRGSPVAFMMACYTGAFDAPEDCLAEEMLRQEGGPVAILSGSRVTMPYGMAVLGMSLLGECFGQRRATLGEMVLHAKRTLAEEQPQDARRAALDLLATAISPAGSDLKLERLEHVELFNLLGDPLLRVPHPQAVHLDVPERLSPGDTLEIQGSSPLAGELLIELVARRDRLTFEPETRRRYDVSPQGRARFDGTYRRANDRRWTSQQGAVDKGPFRLQLDVPQEASGAAYVRAFLRGREDFASGGVPVLIGE